MITPPYISRATFGGVQSADLGSSTAESIRMMAEYITESEYVIPNNVMNINKQCDVILTVYNVSVSHETEDFSLLGDATKDEVKKLAFSTVNDKKQKQSLISAKDKFPIGEQSLQDADSQKVSNFYEQDDEFTSNEKQNILLDSTDNEGKQINFLLAKSMAFPKADGGDFVDNKPKSKYFSKLNTRNY